MKEGQIIAKDFLEKEKRTMSKTGSRANILKEAFKEDPILLTELDLEKLMQVVQ